MPARSGKSARGRSSRSGSVPRILVHGGAGSSRPGPRQLETLEMALEAGYACLDRGTAALDAVETSIMVLEASGCFNAGPGGRLQMDGRIRLDASLMDGKDLAAGAVAALESIRHPICAARRVMETTPHVLIVSGWARRLARAGGIPVFRSGTEPKTRRGVAVRKEMDTVGAVAIDRHGHLAAGTSTGGIPFMLPGRVGDSPLIGAGTYADDRAGAVSATGHGESIIRIVLAKEIVLYLERGLSPVQAGKRALHRLKTRTAGDAGVIILDPSGRFALLHTTPFLIAGYQDPHTRKTGGRFDRIA